MQSRTLTLLLALGIGFGVGALTVSRLSSDESSVDGSLQNVTGDIVRDLKRSESGELDSGQLAQVLESLTRILDEEISERGVLEEELDGLRLELADLRKSLNPDVQDAASALREAGGRGSLNERLVAQGFTQQQIKSIQRSEDESQLQYLELDDQARREGWINTARYYEEMSGLMSEMNPIRHELGDDAYDRYLFASRGFNRVMVDKVFETSRAAEAGLRAGDTVKSYDGKRVFSMQELQSFRSSGERGEPVTVEIIREGQLIQITIPRGPIGIQTRSGRADPSLPTVE